MAKAGCTSIDFALESGSPRVLKAIRKDLDPACVAGFARVCRELSIRALVFVMYSLPEETADDFRRTVDVLRRIRSDIYDISFSHALILPGTTMEQQARDLGLLPESFSWYDPSFTGIPRWQSHMNDTEIRQCREWLEDYRYRLHHPSWSIPVRRARRLQRRLVDSTIAIMKEQTSLMNALESRPRLLGALKGVARTLRAG